MKALYRWECEHARMAHLHGERAYGTGGGTSNQNLIDRESEDSNSSLEVDRTSFGSDLENVEEQPELEAKLRESGIAQLPVPGIENAPPILGPISSPLTFDGIVRLHHREQHDPPESPVYALWLRTTRSRPRLTHMFCWQVPNKDQLDIAATRRGQLRVLRTSNDSPVESLRRGEGDRGRCQCARLTTARPLLRALPLLPESAQCATIDWSLLLGPFAYAFRFPTAATETKIKLG